jgi:hypothetical protein
VQTATTSPEALLARLDEAARGLLFPSESDFPIAAFRLDGEATSPEALLAALGLPPETPVEAVTPEDLFAPLIAPEEGGEPERYGRLLSLLHAELEELRAYRVGRVTIDVYVLGRHRSGPWLGLKTKVVET